MRGVSPEVVWDPRLFFIGSVGPDMLCWRPVCVRIHLGGLHSRSAVCSYVWHITEEPITHDSILALSMTMSMVWFSGCLQIAKLDAETHPDPRPASPEKKAGPKSIGTSAEKASPRVFSVQPTHALHSPLSTVLAQYLCLHLIFCGPGTCYGVSSPPRSKHFRPSAGAANHRSSILEGRALDCSLSHLV